MILRMYIYIYICFYDTIHIYIYIWIVKDPYSMPFWDLINLTFHHLPPVWIYQHHRHLPGIQVCEMRRDVEGLLQLRQTPVADQDTGGQLEPQHPMAKGDGTAVKVFKHKNRIGCKTHMK